MEVEMADQYKIRIKLLKNDRPCNQGLKPGTEWLYDNKTPQGLCSFAFNSLRPFIEVLKNGGSFPWEGDPNVVTQCCPDHLVNNVFEIRREPENEVKADAYDVTVKMVGKECNGECGYGHKEGDTWEVKGPMEMVLENICPSALKAIDEAVMVMRYGGQFPWQTDPETYTVTCPDPNVRNKFELRRTPRK
jgi:uncharacterized repeat protein (TIGR04076 family)